MNIFIFAFVSILSVFLPLNSGYGAALVASKVFDEKAFGKLWERLPPPSKAAQTAKRKAHRDRMRRHGRADGSGPAIDVSPERRRFHADLGGRNYAFEVDEKGGLQVFDPADREVAHASEAFIHVNLDSPELHAAREQMRAYLQKNPVPITTVTFKPGRPVVSASAVLPQARRAKGKARVAGKSTQAPGGSAGTGAPGQSHDSASAVSGLYVRDDASAVVAAADLDRRLDDILSDVMRTESIADDVLDEMFTPINKIPDEIEQMISEMLDDSSRWSFEARSGKSRRAQLEVQKKARREVEAAYAALNRLGSQTRRVDGAERTRLQKQQQAEFSKLAQAISINPRHYKAMNPVEQKSLFYVANQLQIQGKTKKAMKLLNSKGVTLDELGSYKKLQAHILLDIASGAGKHIEVAQAIRAHGFEDDMFVNMLQIPGDLMAGSRLASVTKIQKFSHYLDALTEGRARFSPVVIQRWILMLARQQDLILRAYPDGQEFIRAFSLLLEMTGGHHAFLKSKQISNKDKLMLGVLLKRLNVGDIRTQRAALDYLTGLRINTPEFREGARAVVQLPDIDESEVLELTYDALYSTPLEPAVREKWIANLPVRTDGSNALTRLVRREGVASAGPGVAHSPEAELLRNLQLAEVAHKKGLPRDVLQYIEAVLKTPDRKLLYPGAKERAYELKMMAYSQQLEHAVRLKAPEAEVGRMFQEILNASRERSSKLGATFEKELGVLKDQVTWQIYKGDAAAATLSLWDAVRKTKLGNELSRDNPSWTRLYSSTYEAQGKQLEMLHRLPQATRMTPTQRGYLDTLQKYYEGDVLSADVSKVPSEYKADVLFSQALLTNYSKEGTETFAENATRILKMNPHPVLRDYIHLSLTKARHTSSAALYHALQAADSKVLPAQSKLSAQISGAALRLQGATSSKTVRQTRSTLLTQISKAVDPFQVTNYYPLISSYPLGIESLAKMHRANLEILLASYNKIIHSFFVMGPGAVSHSTIVRFRRERALVLKAMLDRGYDRNMRIRAIADDPAVSSDFKLGELYVMDEDYAYTPRGPAWL